MAPGIGGSEGGRRSLSSSLFSGSCYPMRASSGACYPMQFDSVILPCMSSPRRVARAVHSSRCARPSASGIQFARASLTSPFSPEKYGSVLACSPVVPLQYRVWACQQRSPPQNVSDDGSNASHPKCERRRGFANAVHACTSACLFCLKILLLIMAAIHL